MGFLIVSDVRRSDQVQTSALYFASTRTLIVVTAGVGMRVGNGVRVVAPSDEAPAVLAGVS